MRLIFKLICENAIICLVWVMAISVTQAQQTYSKVFDLEIGSGNRDRCFFIEENSYVVATTHSGDTSVVSALTRFDFSGDILDQNTYSDFVISRSRSVVQTQEGFDVSGYRWSLDENRSRGLQLIKVNDHLDFIEQKLIDYEIERNTNLPGILELNSNQKVVFGSFIDTGPGVDSGAILALLDSETDTIQSKIIFKSEVGNPYVDFSIFDLHETSDGNMVFVAETDKSGNMGENGKMFQIIEFNWDGDIEKRISANLSSSISEALEQDEEGGLYFFSKRTPFLIDSTLSFQNNTGGLVKVNQEMDSVEWSFSIADFNTGSYSRVYTIYGIQYLKDGNLLAVGKAGGQFSECEDLNECIGRIGFMCKFSKEGEVLWMREHGILIPEEYVDFSNFTGLLGASRIRDCKEMEDGRLLCMGINAYRKPEESDYNELWMLMLDEDGCLSPGCGVTNIVTSTSPSSLTQEGSFYPNPTQDRLFVTNVSFDEYKIYDLMGRLILHGDFVSEIHLRGQMSSGMYVLQLKEKGRLKSVFKFLKE